MKLATYKDGSRDGQLVVVSRDLATAHYANGIATRLQQVLDDWNFLSPQLEDLATTLNQGKARHAFPFDPAMCMAPLPRACQHVNASAYLPHVERLCRLHGLALPGQLKSEPLLAQRASDELLGARDDLVVERVDDGIDFGAGLAVITGDVARGVSPAQALESVRLVTLANDWRLRGREAAELARGWGLCQQQPGTALAPVAVTPDELGEAWQGGRVQLKLQISWNERKVGLLDAGAELQFHVGQLLAQLARVRRLRAGTLLTVGPVALADPSHGHACLADRRALAPADSEASSTGWAQYGDTVRIEMKGRDGLSLFGAIEQTVSDPA